MEAPRPLAFAHEKSHQSRNQTPVYESRWKITLGGIEAGTNKRWRDQQYTTVRKGGQTETVDFGRTRHSVRGKETNGGGWLVESGRRIMSEEDVGIRKYKEISERILNDTDKGVAGGGLNGTI